MTLALVVAGWIVVNIAFVVLVDRISSRAEAERERLLQLRIEHPEIAPALPTQPEIEPPKVDLEDLAMAGTVTFGSDGDNGDE